MNTSIITNLFGVTNYECETVQDEFDSENQ
jgi:hypothetical protein